MAAPQRITVDEEQLEPMLSRLGKDKHVRPSDIELYDAFERHAIASVEVEDLTEELKAAKARLAKANRQLIEVGERLCWSRR
jgi:hypothetical protein